MSIRVKLLETLDGKPGRVFSGEGLARRFGVSRAAVWKQMQSMRHIGLPIESTGREGYRLQAPFDSSLIRFRPSRWVIPHYYLNTPSTQILAKAGAAAGLPEGHLWIAETQSQGRGRLDRSWESAYGGLWISLLLRPKMPASRVPPLTLLAGLALKQAVNKISRLESKLKWPNDLLVPSPPAPLPTQGEGGQRPGEGGWKKLAGILTEMSGQMDRTEWVAIGVGLNVNNAISKELFGRAASLYGLTGGVSPRAAFLETFLRIFRSFYLRYQKEGFEPFRRAYWKGYFAPGKTVHLATSNGPITGKARGIDGSGAIMIESRRKIHTITEGEIVL